MRASGVSEKKERELRRPLWWLVVVTVVGFLGCVVCMLLRQRVVLYLWNVGAWWLLNMHYDQCSGDLCLFFTVVLM